MSVHRAMGIETEYGVLEPGVAANVIELSDAVVRAYAASVPHSEWDYAGEDPLADARGFRLPRASADPSMLTDEPSRAAQSGPAARVSRIRETKRRVGPENAVLTNGARLYVDHAHPEYSGPEVLDPFDAVLYDRAGDLIMKRALELLEEKGRRLAIYKNNVDGKGASYGTHENYLVDRALPFGDIVEYMTPFFVTRPLICGAGRVGLGKGSEEQGFQISQRADYLENEVGLETTFNRPIINTRDEPHAEARRWRRLHVIVGDANAFDVSTMLKVGVTSLVLWFLERGEVPLDLNALALSAPVVDAWGVSREPLDHPLSVASGNSTALDVQRIFRDLIGEALHADGEVDSTTAAVMDTWTHVLDGLATDPESVASEVEWVAKRSLLSRIRERAGVGWGHPKIAAADLQWSNVDPALSLVGALDRSGRVARLVDTDEIARAVETPPSDTRAYFRGEMIRCFPDEVTAASWSSVLINHPHGGEHVRFSLPDPYGANHTTSHTFFESTLEDALAALE